MSKKTTTAHWEVIVLSIYLDMQLLLLGFQCNLSGIDGFSSVIAGGGD